MTLMGYSGAWGKLIHGEKPTRRSVPLTLVEWPFWRPYAEWPTLLSVLAVPPLQLIQNL